MSISNVPLKRMLLAPMAMNGHALTQNVWRETAPGQVDAGTSGAPKARIGVALALPVLFHAPAAREEKLSRLL